MKHILLVIAFLFGTLLATTAPKTTAEFVGGSITAHYPLHEYDGITPNFKVALSKDGLIIFNPLLAMCLTREDGAGHYASVMFFGGDNSVGSVMAGAALTGGFLIADFLYLGVVLGGYIQSDMVYSATHLTRYPVALGDNDLVPIAGIELNIRAMLSEHAFFKTRLLVLPVLANLTVSLGFQL